jgi:recombination protein RecA
VSKTGAWYAYDGERLGQGRERAAAHLIEHPEVAGRLRAALLERGRAVLPAVTGEEPEAHSEAA